MNTFRSNKAVSSVDNDESTEVDPIDPSALGFTKVAYAVDETLELLSIGRTADCTHRSNVVTSSASSLARDVVLRCRPCRVSDARLRQQSYNG